MAVQKRNLDRLLRGIGEDTNLAETPILDSTRIVITTQLDDLSRAHGALAFGRMVMTIIPSAGVANFSGFQCTPFEGFWIRELSVAGSNANVSLSVGAPPAFAVADALTNPVLCGRPDNTDFPAFLQSTVGTLVAGSATVPRILRDAQIGQSLGALAGLFITSLHVVRDLWIPAGVTIDVRSTATNIAMTTHLQLDLPAENFFT